MFSRIKFKSQTILALSAAITIGVIGGTTAGFAQEKKKDAASAKAQSAWIKICDDVKLQEVKDQKATSKKICMTHHESLSARTGTPLVSAAVRNVAGHDKERFLVTVPLGMAIPAGVHVKVDDKEPLKFKYSFCHVAGCVAETPMTPELLKQMRAGKKLVVATISISGKPVGFPIPLSGFDKAYKGKPIDGEKYANARKAMMLEIRKRQVELAKKAELEKLNNADNPRKK
jgi:invasion protein IalB